MSNSTPSATAEEVPAEHSQRLSLLIHLLALELLGRAAEGLAKLALTERQYVALAVLATEKPGSQHELGKLMALPPQLVVSLTDSLEDGRLVSRRTNPNDRRRTLVELTDRGRQVLAEADALTGRVEDALLESLDEHQRKQLRESVRVALGAAHSDGGRTSPSR